MSRNKNVIKDLFAEIHLTQEDLENIPAELPRKLKKDIDELNKSIDERKQEALALAELLALLKSTGMSGDTPVSVALEEYRRQQAGRADKQ